MSDELGKLRPCPFCGEAESLLVQHMDGTTRKPAYRVMCDNCGASSGYSDRGDHINEWNVRAETDALNARIAELEAQVRTEAPAELVELLDRLSPPGHGIALKGDPTQTFHTGHDVYLAQRVRAWLATHESRLRGEGE